MQLLMTYCKLLISLLQGPVSDVTVHAEQFLRTTKDKLTPELQDELTNIVRELRTTYERLQTYSIDWLKQAEDLLAALKKDRDENVRIFYYYYYY